jgi:hypothetical protein
MTEDDVDIRLIGYSAFKASTRFLCSLEDEISVERWGTPFRKFNVDRVPGIRTGEDLRRALELPCAISVVSAHGGDSDGMFFCKNHNGDEYLEVNSIRTLGATTAVLVDACWAKKLFRQLERPARQGTLLVGIDAPTRKIDGRDSVAVLGGVIRELCYSRTSKLDTDAVRCAVTRVNAQISARNKSLSDAEFEEDFRRPDLLLHECK